MRGSLEIKFFFWEAIYLYESNPRRNFTTSDRLRPSPTLIQDKNNFFNTMSYYKWDYARSEVSRCLRFVIKF